MKLFHVGAMRPAAGNSRHHRIQFANELVRRTLAQNGLTVPDTGKSVEFPYLSGLGTDLLAKYRQRPAKTGALDPELPTGAVFRHDIVSCAAGSRSYRTYLPSNAAEGISGIIVMLHGCTQNPEDFATGTRMNVLAESHGIVIAYPHQSRGENAQSCWNWFRRSDQQRDRGEPAILAQMARDLMTEFDVKPERTFVAGLSAGAAMAVILGETYPDVFAAVGAHSGLPFGVARDVPSAFEAMAGRGQMKAISETAAVPTILFHGTADTTVHISNSDRIGRDVIDRSGDMTIETELGSTIAGREVRRTISTTENGKPMLEQWHVEGLGHAWSGGNPAGSFADAAGPDASKEMLRFFLETAK